MSHSSKIIAPQQTARSAKSPWNDPAIMDEYVRDTAAKFNDAAEATMTDGPQS